VASALSLGSCVAELVAHLNRVNLGPINRGVPRRMRRLIDVMLAADMLQFPSHDLMLDHCSRSMNAGPGHRQATIGIWSRRRSHESDVGSWCSKSPQDVSSVLMSRSTRLSTATCRSAGWTFERRQPAHVQRVAAGPTRLCFMRAYGLLQPFEGIRPLSMIRTSPSTPVMATLLSILAASRIRHASSTFRSASTIRRHSESRC
jgi:hypothetical protein